MNDSLIVPCSHCSTLNRVPAARLADVPVCRDCGSRLLGMPPAHLTADTFDRFVSRSDLPVVVDFWAPWCRPCRSMEPEFERAAATLAGSALLAKVDTEQHPDLASRFGITGIPTLLLFEHGAALARTTGTLGASEIVAWVRGQPSRETARHS